MKKVIHIFLFVALTLWASSAYAGDYYFSAGGGIIADQSATADQELISQTVTEGAPVLLLGDEISQLTTVTATLDSKADFSVGYAGYAAIGKRMNKYLRVELEYAYKSSNVDQFEELGIVTELVQSKLVSDPGTPDEKTNISDGTVTEISASNSFDPDADLGIHTIMINGLLDLKNDTIVTPFIGLGFGTAFLNLDADGFEESDNAFAYQAIGGASLEFTKALHAQAFYRYLNVPNAKLFEGTYELESHSVEMGIVYNF